MLKLYMAVDELLAAHSEGQSLELAIIKVKRALDDHQLDLTDGRLHDCPSCIDETPETPG